MSQEVEMLARRSAHVRTQHCGLECKVALSRSDLTREQCPSVNFTKRMKCRPERRLPRFWRQTELKDLWLFFTNFGLTTLALIAYLRSG